MKGGKDVIYLIYIKHFKIRILYRQMMSYYKLSITGLFLIS
ncbi:hypothetical protein ING2E5A_2174 [Petrimonas mucosa]|uniref:Uncharacterized protein n=1 Tax=Petrimonas mucosa TaxID=1642646 RepID=A0A1G4G8X2_9BACT|nr:hypothetical protein ING2E5A_2174 [Petrimonas mucosa]